MLKLLPIAVLCALAVCASASDQLVKLSNGSIVVLHDDGHWEYYQTKEIKDIRPAAIPESVKTTISVTYEGYDKLAKNLRLAMEADLATEEEINDSLRTLPKGGMVHFCIPTEQIDKNNPHDYVYILSYEKTQLYRSVMSQSKAVDSDEKDISYLLSVPVYKKPKSGHLTARIETVDGKQDVEFDVPIK